MRRPLPAVLRGACRDSDRVRRAAQPLKGPRDPRWEFELAALGLDRPEVRDLAASLSMPVGDGGRAALVTLPAGGSAGRHPLAAPHGRLDREAVAAFLLAEKLPTCDAERMLAEAFGKAKAEDKRVFLIASASWCGPYRMLTRFLTPYKRELEKHVVFVKLDVSWGDGDAVRQVAPAGP